MWGWCEGYNRTRNILEPVLFMIVDFIRYSFVIHNQNRVCAKRRDFWSLLTFLSENKINAKIPNPRCSYSTSRLQRDVIQYDIATLLHMKKSITAFIHSSEAQRPSSMARSWRFTSLSFSTFLRILKFCYFVKFRGISTENSKFFSFSDNKECFLRSYEKIIQ